MADYIIRTARKSELPAIGALHSYNSRTTLNTEYIDYRYLDFLTPEEAANSIKKYFVEPDNIIIAAVVPGEDEEVDVTADFEEAGADSDSACGCAGSGAADAAGSADVEPEICCGKTGEIDVNPDSSVLLGYCAGRPSPDVLGAFWLEKLDVNEDARGEGIGKALIFEMGRRAAALGYPQMVIDALEGNYKAESIYRHLGAKVINKNYIQDIQGFLVKSTLLAWDDLDVFNE